MEFKEGQKGFSIVNLTWRCDICGKEKPDNEIGVVTYPLKDLLGAVRNLKVCKYSGDCQKKAEEKSNTGKM